MKNTFLVIFGIFLLSSCTIMVKTFNESKGTPKISTSEMSQFANSYFWENFHDANYEKVDSIIFYLMAAYHENKNDLPTVAHLGFSHIWKMSEMTRLSEIDPRIIDDAVLSQKYFGEAYRLNPEDPRILGFLADLKMTNGSISKDYKLSRQGFFDGQKSINQWSSFNYFTIGYLLSNSNKEEKMFQKALEWQWKTLDDCYCEKFDRENPSIKKYLEMEQTETNIKRKRACWNSWVAPHNVEGFYLNMGDMLVKSGDWEKGIKIYNLAKQVPQYNTWVHKDFLERRITNAEQNAINFNTKGKTDDDIMLVSTSISCAICHQMSDKDKIHYKDYDWKTELDMDFYQIKNSPHEYH